MLGARPVNWGLQTPNAGNAVRKGLDFQASRQRQQA